SPRGGERRPRQGGRRALRAARDQWQPGELNSGWLRLDKTSVGFVRAVWVRSGEISVGLVQVNCWVRSCKNLQTGSSAQDRRNSTLLVVRDIANEVTAQEYSRLRARV